MDLTKRNTLVGLGVVLAVSLFASWPLFAEGFIPTHDGEYHIIRFWQFFKMLTSGSFFPRWAPDINSGYGLPLFNFHYPFPNYIGAFFHLMGVSFVDSFKLALGAGYLTAVVACFYWLKKSFHPYAAAIGTIVFSSVPYWFVDIYVRGSIGEVWAIAFFFISLRLIEKQYLTAAFSVALLILSHNIMAMLLIPTLCVYAYIRNRTSLPFIVAGLLLSAYFWLPAIAERGFVTGLNSVDFRDHFVQLFQLVIPSWGTGFSVREMTSSEMSFQIGVVSMLVVFLTLFRIRKLPLPGKLFLLMGSLAVFFMLDVSQPFWESITVLQLVQYPWRLLVFVLPLAAYLSSFVASLYPRWIAVTLCIVAVGVSVKYMRPVVYAPRSDEHYLTRPEFTDGTSSIGNTFSTIWTDWKQTRAQKRVEAESGNARVISETGTPLRYRIDVEAQTPVIIRVNTLYYPGWTVEAGGRSIPIQYEKQGIIEFLLESGQHLVDVRFGETPLRKLADMISVCSFAILIILGYTLKKYAHRNTHRTPHKRA